MKNFLKQLTLVFVLAMTGTSGAFAQQKIAQTGFKFLNIGTDARCSGLVGAMTAIEGTSASLFYNPSAMARMEGSLNFSVGKTLWFADIEYSHVSAAFPIGGGDYGVVGLSLQVADYGDFNQTIRANNDAGYLDLGKFSPSSLGVGLGYAKALNDKFSIGGNVKYARQFLGNGIVAYDTTRGSIAKQQDFRTDVVAFDIGLLYRTGFKSLNFGMTVRNFAREIRYVDENFQLPLTFKIGLSMDMMDWLDVNKEEQSFLLTADVEHPRDFSELLRVAGEYTIFKLFSVRGGYVFGGELETYSIGFGLQKQQDQYTIGADYAYAPFGELGNIHRFSVQFTL